MSIAHFVLAPFRILLGVILALFRGLDRGLVLLARPFGVNVKSPWLRYAILLGEYAVIYLLALLPVPIVPLAALGVGYVGVLAVGRAWVLNEKQRGAIAKKLRDGNPDEMPDLRGIALLSALQLLILFPLFFQQVQRQFGLYKVPEGATFWTWVLFTLDSYSKAFLGLLEIYGIHFNRIELDANWGRHLVTLKRLTFDYILIQGIIRLFAIRETIRDAVAAVKNDRELAERLGRRAIGPLIRALRYDANAEVRGRAAEALGTLGGPRAVEPLLEALRGPSEVVRERAAKALGALGDTRAIPALRAAAEDPDRYVKAAAADALKRLDPDGTLQQTPRRWWRLSRSSR
jgi:hypothetical protein